MSLNFKACLFFYLLMILSAVSFTAKLEVQSDTSSEIAQQQLQQIRKQTKHMKYGKCWTKALDLLERGCRDLSDEIQRRIAYAFARCHLQSAGRDIPECSPDQSVLECTNENALKDLAFVTYTEFFDHSQQICFHLQSQVWHEATENTISKLADNSAEVASTLQESSVMAREMVERQNLTLQNQEELLRNERLLRENMLKSVLDVQKSYEETKVKLQEQKALFAEVFDRVSNLQKTVLGEFTSVYTFGFYIGTSILIYILTSTPRISSARIWLFGLLTLNVFTERTIANYHLAATMTEENMFVESSVLSETVYADMWLCRKIYSIIAFVTMLVCIIRYRDYNKINYNLLTEIKRQNNELQDLLKEQAFASSHSINGLTTPQKQGTESIAVCDLSNGVHTENRVQQVFGMGNDTVATLNSTIHSDLSAINDLTVVNRYESDDDDTYVAGEDSCNSSVSSYATGSSRRSTLTSRSVTAMMTSFRRSSTPSSTRSRRSSIASTSSFLEQLDESIAEVEGVIIGGHNLRRRRTTNYSNSPVSRESVEEFIGAVAKVTSRRRRLLQ